MDFQMSLFHDILHHFSDGIIIMGPDRDIKFLNQAAVELTGWDVGNTVPFCSYCEQRIIPEGESRCILANDDPLPFFHSHMAVYKGKESFEMALKKITYNEEEYSFLRLNKPDRRDQVEKAEFHELLAQETLNAQEAERQRIARELHDHIGQNVYSIFLGLEGIRGYLDDSKAAGHLEKMTSMIEKTLVDIKRLSKNLRPDTVQHLGLEEALNQAVRDWECFYEVDISLKLDLESYLFAGEDKELHLFRVIQEAVRNAVSHGKATSIMIELKAAGQVVNFNVEDNGTGFDIETRKKKGLGIKHMYERCRMLDGDIRWVSGKGRPTRVEGFVSMRREG